MKKISLLILVAVIVIGTGLFLQQSNKKSPSEEIAIPTKIPTNPLESREDNQGEVVVRVTPIKFSSKENVEFNISLSTHSVELDKSLKDVSLLEDDEGNIYDPISWSGGIGGHHLEGELIFPSFSSKAKDIRLIIKQIGGVDRIFKWDL